MRNNNKNEKKEMIDRGTITDPYEIDIKKYNQLRPDKTSNIFYQKKISKTPDKLLKNKLHIKKESKSSVSKNKTKANIDIKELNNIYNAIKMVDYQLSLIEKDSKQKNLNNNIYSYNKNKDIDNLFNKKIVNNKNKRAVTPIKKKIIGTKNISKSNKKNVSALKTFENNNNKGYKDILIEKIEYTKNKNKQNNKFQHKEMNRAKTPNNYLKKKVPKNNNYNNIVSYKTNTNRNNFGINRYKYAKEKEPINIVNYVNLPTGNNYKRPEWK